MHKSGNEIQQQKKPLKKWNSAKKQCLLESLYLDCLL